MAAMQSHLHPSRISFAAKLLIASTFFATVIAWLAWLRFKGISVVPTETYFIVVHPHWMNCLYALLGALVVIGLVTWLRKKTNDR
jgi:hypothetical protein